MSNKITLKALSRAVDIKYSKSKKNIVVLLYGGKKYLYYYYPRTTHNEMMFNIYNKNKFERGL